MQSVKRGRLKVDFVAFLQLQTSSYIEMFLFKLLHKCLFSVTLKKNQQTLRLEERRGGVLSD